MSSVTDFLLDFKSHRDFKSTIPLLVENDLLRNAVFKEIASETYPFPEYSSWLAIHFFDKNKAYFTQDICNFLIEILIKTKNHTVQRNICTSLTHFKGDLTERTDLLDRLFFLLAETDSLPALRIHALRNIELHYLKKYPELLTEVFSVLELLEQHDLPSIRSMIRNFYKKYKTK
jgi:hypothetical protein